MAILAIEDDPQNGWDHVSGYRTTAYVASPYARRRAVVSTQYNTTSLLRTIEQILGLPPMNQFDASAEPLRDCFTDTPDLTPFTALPSNIPLDQMNGDPQSLRDPQLRADALACEQMNFDQVDRAPEDALNRVLWRRRAGPQSRIRNGPYTWSPMRIDGNGAALGRIGAIALSARRTTRVQPGEFSLFILCRPSRDRGRPGNCPRRKSAPSGRRPGCFLRSTKIVFFNGRYATSIGISLNSR